MSAGISQTPASVETQILQFARAFRSAARVVGFYPSAHPAVGTSLEHVAAAARSAAAGRPLALTILPDAFLVAGEPLESRETAIAELAEILHRHRVGAMNLRGSAGTQAWRALFELLALPPEDISATGGIQRRWMALRHSDPVILEIDFGEMLRGRVGGDFAELAGVINHYLEAAGVGSSFTDDPYAILLAALERAVGDEAAVTTLIAELRAGAQLIRMTQADRFDHLMRNASRIGEHLTESQMAGLLGERGQPTALVGAVDVVASLIERMSDTTVARFLAAAMSIGDRPSDRLIEVFTSLAPDAQRRSTILPMARASVAGISPDAVAGWTDLERQLESLSDRQFVSDAYERELETARRRSEEAGRLSQDPPERIAAWVQSLDDGAVADLDLRLIEDLARIEQDPAQFRVVVGILIGRINEAAEPGDWATAGRLAAALMGAVRTATAGELAEAATHAHTLLRDSPACADALAALEDARTAAPVGQIRFLLTVGPALIPRIVRRWVTAKEPTVRARLESALGEFGKEGREALRRMLGSTETSLKTAAIRLLNVGSATDHLGALESLLTDASQDVRQEALRALTTAEADRAHEVLARGIARADADQQLALVGELVAVSGRGLVPVLRRLVSYLDQAAVDPQVYLAVIDGLKQAGGPEAASALRQVSERGSWRTPLRTMKFRGAAKNALRTIGSPDLTGGRHA